MESIQQNSQELLGHIQREGKSREPNPGLEWGVWEGQDMEGAQQQQDLAPGGFFRVGFVPLLQKSL